MPINRKVCDFFYDFIGQYGKYLIIQVCHKLNYQLVLRIELLKQFVANSIKCAKLLLA